MTTQTSMSPERFWDGFMTCFNSYRESRKSILVEEYKTAPTWRQFVRCVLLNCVFPRLGFKLADTVEDSPRTDFTLLEPGAGALSRKPWVILRHHNNPSEWQRVWAELIQEQCPLQVMIGYQNPQHLGEALHTAAAAATELGAQSGIQRLLILGQHKLVDVDLSRPIFSAYKLEFPTWRHLPGVVDLA